MIIHQTKYVNIVVSWQCRNKDPVFFLSFACCLWRTAFQYTFDIFWRHWVHTLNVQKSPYCPPFFFSFFSYCAKIMQFHMDGMLFDFYSFCVKLKWHYNLLPFIHQLRKWHVKLINHLINVLSVQVTLRPSWIIYKGLCAHFVCAL